MRKKSHLSLAGYLIRELGLKELEKYKKSFYFGSILPDLSPKMITSPHEFTTTFEDLQRSIRKITENRKETELSARAVWRNIGVILHYLGDYFTFPHNTSYDGNLKDHCLYERDMKYCLREYVRTSEAKMIFKRQHVAARQILSVNDLLEGIAKAHRIYMKEQHTVETDCRWIVEQCSKVLIYLAMTVSEEYMDRYAAVEQAA